MGTMVVTDIPYQLEAEMSPNTANVLANLASGRLPGVSCFNGATVEANRQAALKWLAKFRLNFFSRLFQPTVTPF